MNQNVPGSAQAARIVEFDFEASKQKLKALYALGKPNLSLLVVVTAVIGFVVASGPEASALRAVMLVVGTGLTAMGACAANMCKEASIDGLMKRTRTRPIPSGRVDEAEAFAFSVVTSLLGFALLYVFCGPLPAILAAATISIYAFIYTPSKLRGPVSVWIGAVPGAVPPLMGWATATGQLGWGGWSLFALLFCWQFPHFLALAYMYREDYARAGFRFLPPSDVEARTGRHIFWGAVATVTASAAPVMLELVGWVYGLLAIWAGYRLLKAALSARIKLDAQSAKRAFLASILYLPVLLVAVVLDRAVGWLIGS